MRAASNTTASTSGRFWCSSPSPNARCARPAAFVAASVPIARRRCRRCNQTTSTTSKTLSTFALPASSSSSSSPSNSPREKTKWIVRPIRPDEIVAAAELQARAFYTSYPLGPLDALMFYQFRGEVLSGLQSKMKYSHDDGFVCLVAVAAADQEIGKEEEKKKSSDDDNELSSSSSSSTPAIAGVVEVSLQAEKKELEALWAATGISGLTFESGGNSDDVESESENETAPANGLLFGDWGPGGSTAAAAASSSSSSSSSSSITTGDDSYAYVACMAVDERLRRKGAASALLSAAERVAGSGSGSSSVGGGGGWRKNWVLLHVHESNKAARELYEANGYVALTPPERPGIIGAPRVLMGKSSSCGGGGGFDEFSSSLSSLSTTTSSTSSSVPGGGIVSMPSNLLESLKRDTEQRAAAAAAAKKKAQEEERRRG